jgi:hypothetical protein
MSNHLRFAIVFLLLGLAGCASSANSGVVEQEFATLAGNCRGGNSQSCVRMLESKCQAPISACTTAKSTQSQIASDLDKRCSAGDSEACNIIASSKCDAGDQPSCDKMAARYAQLQASCKSGRPGSACDDLAAGPWPVPELQAADTACKQGGNRPDCVLIEKASLAASGVAVSIGPDFR